MIKLDPAILNNVTKPARYTGGEWNSIVKNHQDIDVSFALAFPDVYEVGMSYLGFKLLYNILNQRQDTAAERVYAPWVDMEEAMREHDLPLYSLETKTPLHKFDLVGFTLQYEMTYTNIINMLDLGKIPVFTRDRTIEHPFVAAGGPCCYNPEPLADFVDFVFIGEADESIEEVVESFKEWKKDGKQGGRIGFLERIAMIEGIYVPSFYDISYNADGTVQAIMPNNKSAKAKVIKRVIKDVDTLAYPTKPIVPFIDTVHDRINLEIFRGCTRGCRFCQAGTIYRPIRERKIETLLKQAEELVDSTGYSEISLTSLSSADYSGLRELISRLTEKFKERGVSVSLPSLRIDSFCVELAQEVQKVRKSGLTFAPEAGTQRMRDVINKGVTEEDLEKAVSAAFDGGWSTVKLYFMIGLPTETDEDIKGIADLANKVINIYKEVKGRRGAKVTVSVSSFVPKCYTPFQWYGQNTVEELTRKQQYLRSLIRDRSISYNYHDAHTSYLEAVIARGDRKVGKAIYEAFKLGARFDGWSEHFKFNIWQKAFEASEINPEFFAHRDRKYDEVLPWEHITPGVSKEYLINEYEKATQGEFTKDCRRDVCGVCGVCQDIDVSIVDWGMK